MATYLVTGANRGIGFELAKQLSERGEDVIATCRGSSGDLGSISVRVLENVDVSNDSSVAALTETLSGENLDVLINNAGILTSETLDDLNVDRIRKQFEVNTLGPLRMTKALLPNLSKGSKVGIVSSRVGSITDNTSGGMYGYRASKCAVNMMGTNLMHDLKPKGIAVALLHPGYVATDMTNHSGPTKAADAAAGLIQRMDELNLENAGTFWHAEGQVLPW